MAAKFDQSAATAVVGLAVFQLWDVWHKNAPSLEECRRSHPADDGTRQGLLDAELTVGTLAVTTGSILAFLTHDVTALIIMVGIFAVLVFMHHWILASTPIMRDE